MSDITQADLLRRFAEEGIDGSKAWALIPQWVESGPRSAIVQAALVAPDLILRSDGTAVFLDRLLWPKSKDLADKHAAGQSNPESLPWNEFVASVTEMESRSMRIARELMAEKQGGAWDEVTPYPLYDGDIGWSFERDRRGDKIGELLDVDRLYTKPPRAHSKELLSVLRYLVYDTENAARKNPKARGGTIWTAQSRFAQEWLSAWFRATADRVA